jgi:hypothetical protein
MFDENFKALNPINFFQLSVECPFFESDGKKDQLTQKKYLLPDTSFLCDQDSFAKVFMGWNKEGLHFLIEVDKPIEDCFFPEIESGDSVELLIDTRDVKTSGFNTRFCHHFFFLPEAVDGHHAGEITRFRTEDAHELCDPNELIVTHVSKKQSYSVKIFIPSHCLVGYDPDQFNRLGFSYRINRPQWKSQHFSAVTDEFQIEHQPSLWSSVKLIK